MPRPAVGGAPTVWAVSGSECWLVKAQLAGILVSECQHRTERTMVLRNCIAGSIIPILRIMRLLQRIANTSMTSCKHTLPRPRQLRGIELEIHQLVHIVERDHVAIQLDDALILDQREGGQFAPAVVEPHVIGVVL